MSGRHDGDDLVAQLQGFFVEAGARSGAPEMKGLEQEITARIESSRTLMTGNGLRYREQGKRSFGIGLFIRHTAGVSSITSVASEAKLEMMRTFAPQLGYADPNMIAAALRMNKSETFSRKLLDMTLANIIQSDAGAYARIEFLISPETLPVAILIIDEEAAWSCGGVIRGFDLPPQDSGRPLLH